MFSVCCCCCCISATLRFDGEHPAQSARAVLRSAARFTELELSSTSSTKSFFHLSRPLRSLVLCAWTVCVCVLQASPPTVASKWTASFYSCGVARAVRRFFVWPELAASVQSLCPCLSALSRWHHGAPGPLLGRSCRAGGSGSGACRRPPDPPAPSDPQAPTDTRSSSVSPARSP